jgi:ABC-type dipeptide/oligopeptide/nickel transport system permease subunit
MKYARIIAITVVSVVALFAVTASLFSRFDYRRQDREHFAGSPSAEHWLGTDALGRDRLARILHGARLSLSLAPAAAGLTLLLAFVFGAVPGFCGHSAERVAKIVIDLMLSLPWLFVLLMARALLPLNTSPASSALVTFFMLGLLGWGFPARVLHARASRLRRSEFALSARAAGISQARLLRIHLLPNLRPLLVTQFWIAVPVFVLAEANLSLLGLGVSEPLPSLGSLLREMESGLSLGVDFCSITPLLLLLLIVASLQMAFQASEVN